MTEIQYKQCLMCSTIYQGDPKKYTGENVSHGVCPKDRCQLEFVMQSYNIKHEGLARSILESMNKKYPGINE